MIKINNLLLLKLNILLISIILMPLSSESQPYRPFIDSTSEWYIGGWVSWAPGEEDYWAYKLFVSEDTIVDSISYHIVRRTSVSENDYRKFLGGSHLIREDSTGKVFVRAYDRNNSKFLGEYLLYDFSLLPGDTIVYFSDNKYLSCMDRDTVICVLESIDTIQLSGINLRRFHFNRSNFPSKSVWIEGIGCIDRGVFSPHCYVFESGEYLTCFRNDGFSWNFNSNCFYLDVGEEQDVEQITCYPNPVNNQLHFDNIVKNCVIDIFNINGQLVVSEHLGANSSVNLSRLPSGIYQIILSHNGDFVWKSKVIKN